MSESEPPPEPADADLQSRLSQTQTELDAARQTIVSLERRQKIDQLLAQSEPIDLEVARLMTEAAVQLMEEPDIKLAIDDLRKHKPFLFRRKTDAPNTPTSPATSGAAAMSARGRAGEPPAQAAARRAVESGDRRDLLRYLRLRRKG